MIRVQSCLLVLALSLYLSLSLSPPPHIATRTHIHIHTLPFLSPTIANTKPHRHMWCVIYYIGMLEFWKLQSLCVVGIIMSTDVYREGLHSTCIQTSVP